MKDLESAGFGQHAERQRRRSIFVLAALGSVLLLSFVIAFAFIQGWLPPKPVPAAKPTPVPTPTMTCTTAPPLPETATIVINVYNSTDRNRLAGATSKVLKSHGFVVKRVANDPMKKKITSVAEIRFGPSGTAKAEVLAARFPGAEKVQDARADDTVDVSLGTAFTAVAPPSTATPTKKC